MGTNGMVEYLDFVESLFPSAVDASKWFFLWQAIIPITISRVNQFDAARLDVEMSAMLKEQLVKVFSLMKVSVFCY